MSGPLAGVRVLEITSVVLGPWAAMLLGDMGADVIKVEPPQGDSTRHIGPRRHDGMASMFLSVNRNKRSIVLDLKHPDGHEAVRRLCRESDVLLHNLRPGAAARLKLDYPSLAADNSRLIYCGTYGYGAAGPYADYPAYDDIVQAAAGLSALQEKVHGEPLYMPTIMADKTTSMACVSAISAALYAREKSGRGQAIEVPMFETLVAFSAVEHMFGETFEPALGPTGYHRVLSEHRRPHRTADGFIALLPHADSHWRHFLGQAGRADLLDDPRFATLAIRMQHIGEIYGLVAEIVAGRTTAEWLDLLDPNRVPVMAVKSFDDLIHDEQLARNSFWFTGEHPSEGAVKHAGIATRWHDTPGSIRRLAPRLGEHSQEILQAVGYDDQAIEALFAAGVSATPAPSSS